MVASEPLVDARVGGFEWVQPNHLSESSVKLDLLTKLIEGPNQEKQRPTFAKPSHT